MLKGVISGSAPRPPRIMLYGEPKVGKTTFAARANALIVDCEGGTVCHPGVVRTPTLNTWCEMLDWLRRIGDEQHDHKVIAIDTLDWMVARMIQHVAIDLDPKAKGEITSTLGGSHGGYFKAREIVANLIYRELIPAMNRIGERGIPIILLSHAVNSKRTLPEGQEIYTASPDIPEWARAIFVEWADVVAFAYAQPDGTRVMRTRQNNVVLAGNRYGLPEEMPLSWAALVDGIKKATEKTTERKAANG